MRERYRLSCVTRRSRRSLRSTGRARKQPGPKSGIWLAVVRNGVLVESRRAGDPRRGHRLSCRAPTPPARRGLRLLVRRAGVVRPRAGMHDDRRRLGARGSRRRALARARRRRRSGATAATCPATQRFRRCEQRYPNAKSIFQLVGNGQVGAGSVRGMPLVARLRAAGLAIWPFDAPGRTHRVRDLPVGAAQALADHDAGPFEQRARARRGRVPRA